VRWFLERLIPVVRERMEGTEPMTFARRVFRIAGVYGIVVLLPQYLLEERIGIEQPPPITHPEHFYGFVGVALAWQVAFLIVARDPVRYRLLMLPAILEKASFGIAALVLFAQQRVPGAVLVFGLIDLVWGALFGAAFRATRGKVSERDSVLQPAVRDG
jgi:hypothetical protein